MKRAPRPSPAPAGRFSSLPDAGRRLAALLVALAATVPNTPVGAQQPEATDTIPLPPLEVNVLRTPFRQDAAPFAVSVLDGEALRRGRSGVFLGEALQGLPGVQVQNRFNPAVGERVAIRGFGARAQFGLRGIRVVVDGIPATLPDGQSTLDHLDIGSLGRVEAVRGPASALFGNASGGVLWFSTRRPSPEPVEVEVEGVGGSNGLVRAQATASGTIGETGYLITGSTQSWDGYRTIAAASPRADTLGDSYGASDRLGLNARLVRELAGGELSLTANVLDLEAENPGSIATDFRGDGSEANAPSWEVADLYLRFRTSKKLTQQQAGVRWAGVLGDDLLGDFSLYGIHRTVDNPIPFNVIDLARRGGGARAQLGRAFPTGAGTLRLQAGAEADLQRDDRTETAAPFGSGRPAPGASPSLDQDESVRSAGVFVQADLELDGGAVLLAGIRFDDHRFEADDRIPVTAGNPDDSGVRTMNAVSPSVGVSVPLGPVFNLFGSVGTVFETPTTTELANQPNAAGGFNPDLEPMTGHSFEAGLRGSASLVAFELTAYQTDLENELVPFEVAGQEGVTFFRNAGTSRHRGVEATASAASRGGLVRGDVTWTRTDARFQTYVLDGESLADNRVPGLAPNRVQALFRLTPRPWFGEAVVSWMDEVQVNDQNTASAPSHTLLDLRAGLSEVRLGGVMASPWVAVTNLLDEAYIASVVVNPTNNRYFEPGPERSLQVGLRASWARD